MSKVVSILEKPRDIYEINSVATRYKSKKVLIYIYDQANYKFQNLKNYILEKKIQNINYKIINLKNVKNCIGILSTSTFYALLKKKNVSIVDTEFLEGNFFYKLFLKLKFNRIKKN